jgi:hypothetical protein
LAVGINSIVGYETAYFCSCEKNKFGECEVNKGEGSNFSVAFVSVPSII